MYQYPNAALGLKRMFIAQIGAIVCTILAVIPVIGLIGGIGALVFAIMSLVGLYGAGHDIEGCRRAFFITIINIVVSIVSVFFATSSISVLFSMIDSVLSFLVVFYVCNSVAEVLSQLGADDVAATGVTVWKVNLGCYIATIVISAVSVIPALMTLAVIASLIVLIASIVAAVFYMIFLNKSYHVLGA